MPPPLFVVGLLALSVIPSTAVHALESDRDQPALIEADEVELDFGSGQRIYRGNVSIKQGTIRIIADELELFTRGSSWKRRLHEAILLFFDSGPIRNRKTSSDRVKLSNWMKSII